jgi:hypothetical protein
LLELLEIEKFHLKTLTKFKDIVYANWLLYNKGLTDVDVGSLISSAGRCKSLSGIDVAQITQIALSQGNSNIHDSLFTLIDSNIHLLNPADLTVIASNVAQIE